MPELIIAPEDMAKTSNNFSWRLTVILTPYFNNPWQDGEYVRKVKIRIIVCCLSWTSPSHPVIHSIALKDY
jgi:hypothetical protein